MIQLFAKGPASKFVQPIHRSTPSLTQEDQMDLSSMLESTARKFPHKEALVAADRRYTYTDLVEHSRRAARVFHDAGLTRGAYVPVITLNTPGFVFAAFGLWRAGMALAPVNHKLTAPELRFLITHCGATVGVVDATLLDTARQAAPDVRWLVTEAASFPEIDVEPGDDFDALLAAAEPWEGVDVSETETAELLYTSGTTSDPKGCIHSHRGITTVAAYCAISGGLQASDRFLIAMPIWHSSPLNNWFLPMMFLGGTAVLLREYHPIEFLRTIEQERVTAFFGPAIAYLAPLQATRAAGIDWDAFDLSSARIWFAGGAPIGKDTMQTMRAAYPSGGFQQVYGMSEMGPVGTVLRPEDQERKAGSVGHAGMPGVDIRVVTLDGRDALPGETGEIWMRSDTRMVGYLGNDEATAKAFDGDWYKSGDLARLDEDGYLFIADRINDMIISGGENVYTLEVENAAREHPGVADIAVVSKPHPEWGETVVAVVVPAADGGPTLEELREFLGERLARYKVPRDLVSIDALPRNPSGKVLKHRLRALVREGVTAA
ncbi:class I adenylate-forming enzyme family protein [Leucobacter aridicollis]|uniref:class I adenylate-forming enzyme family protein n=1 Tax=Leucobacter aridicollis TaxID=283878 RepID=UPI0037CBACD7